MQTTNKPINKKYTCPMHPNVTSDKPGRCPKCGMELEEKAEKHKHHGQDGLPADAGALVFAGWWEKFKMSMKMTMGMEHTGLAGREMAKMMEEDIRNKFFFALVLSAPIVYFSIIRPAPLIAFILTTPVFFYSGWIFLYSTYRALKAKTLNMAVLIAVGITAAYAFSILLTFLGSSDSYYEAAALLITFVLFGHWMEMKSRRGTTDALQALFDLVPPTARKIVNGKEIIVPTSEVRVGDILVLKPGDKVPVDGQIIEGETAIDESLVTGESLPVAKKAGDKVIGGSINQSGTVTFKATKVGEETALAQIVKLVETAQNSKSPAQKIADRFAAILVIVAIGGGLLTFAVWFFVIGQPLLLALTFAISAVVIACPDALGLATPTAVAVGTALGAKHNILIKDAPTLEQLSKIQAMVLDKTGTLTEGKPRVTRVLAAHGFNANEVISLMAAVEAKSNHPLSMAIMDETKRRKLRLPGKVEKFENLVGLGVKGKVSGQEILCGAEKLIKENRIDVRPIEKELKLFTEAGETVVICAVDGKVAGIIGAADPVKPNARRAVKRLNELEIETVMITGDNEATAKAVGAKVGVKRIFANVLPAQKAEYVRRLQKEGKFTAMVGDGVNDAPALAQADVGIAIGAGTDVAIETAKVVLMKSDPADILRAIKLSKATVAKMKQNLFWASIYNLLAIPVAAGVLYPKFGISLRPEISALLMSISSIIVAINAVLLNRAEKDLVEV